MTTKTINTRKAEAVLKLITSSFDAWIDDSTDGPEIVADYAGYGSPAITWESGPYEWAMLFCTMAAGYTATDEEFGFKFAPVKLPAGVEVEPFYSFVLSIYTA